MRLLIVDDSPLIRERVVSAARAIPGVAHVAEASGATEALAALEVVKPDLMVLDLALGAGPTGFEVLDMLRRRASAPRVLVLSNHTDEMFRRRALAMGADAFFDKSHQFGAALDRIAEMARVFRRDTTGDGESPNAPEGGDR